jgi:hypothetical protein
LQGDAFIGEKLFLPIVVIGHGKVIKNLLPLCDNQLEKYSFPTMQEANVNPSFKSFSSIYQMSPSIVHLSLIWFQFWRLWQQARL